MYNPYLQKFFAKKRIRIGDRVSLKRGKNIYSGILMPRTSGGDCIVLKLENGYNIGIKYERGVKIAKA